MSYSSDPAETITQGVTPAGTPTDMQVDPSGRVHVTSRDLYDKLDEVTGLLRVLIGMFSDAFDVDVPEEMP